MNGLQLSPLLLVVMLAGCTSALSPIRTETEAMPAVYTATTLVGETITPSPTETSPTVQPSPVTPLVPVSFADKLSNLCWVAYAPTNFNPNQGKYPSEDSIREDLQVLRQAGFNGLVTYGADQPIHHVAEEIGFEGMILGVWDPTSQAELAYAKEGAQADVVIGYVVGNEGLDVRYDFDTLQTAMDELREATEKPVSTTEQWEDYSGSRLMKLGDWVFPNVHPYWHGIADPQAAVDWTVDRFQELTARTNKPVIFKEVGLPSGGDVTVNESGQAEYYRLLRETATPFVYFEAFDQVWKDWAPVEPYWGLFRSDRSAKAVTQYVCGNTP